MESQHVVQQLIVEVRYAEGMLYFDKSGDTQRQILRKLGEPFKAGETGESPIVATNLVSATEYLTVDYSKERLNVQQQAVATPLRVQEAAKASWDVVAENFDVRRLVTRVGVRCVMTWRAESEEEVDEFLLGAGLIKETETWVSRFGSPVKRAFTGITQTGATRTRYHLANGTVKIEGVISEALQAFQAPQALMLDVDFTEGDGVTSRLTLRGEDLKARIREVWVKTSEAAQALGQIVSGWKAGK